MSPWSNSRSKLTPKREKKRMTLSSKCTYRDLRCDLPDGSYGSIFIISLHCAVAAYHRRAKLFRFDSPSSEWKERGTGDVRLLQNSDTKKVRLVMRRDKTLKVCANHASESLHFLMIWILNTMTLFIRKVTGDMHLQPNIGSERSCVYKVAADYSESPPTAETLAIRFANSTSKPVNVLFRSFLHFANRCGRV